MKKYISIDWVLALIGGLLLALMINYNSVIAKHSTPLFASWITHGIGSISALFLIVAFKQIRKPASFSVKGPRWAYLGGIPGAITVVLASITVNSYLGLSGTLVLMLVGQIIFSIISDIFGLFGTLKRNLTWTDFFVVLSIFGGSGLIIFSKTS